MGVQVGDSLECANCHETFKAAWTEEQAVAEAIGEFGADCFSSEMVIVCDDCYEDMMSVPVIVVEDE